MFITDISDRLLNSPVRVYDSETYYLHTLTADNALFHSDGSLLVKLEDGEITDIYNGNIYEILSPTLAKKIKKAISKI